MLLHNLFIFSSYETDIKFIVFCIHIVGRVGYKYAIWRHVMLCRFSFIMVWIAWNWKLFSLRMCWYFTSIFLFLPQHKIHYWFGWTEKAFNILFFFLFCMGDVCAHCYILFTHRKRFSCGYCIFHNIHPIYPYNK